MRNSAKALIGALIVVAGLAIGCAGTVTSEASSNDAFKIITSESVDWVELTIVEDKETGVQYVIAKMNDGVSITPRLK